MPLTKSTPVTTWISDFVNSDDPRFDGKSKEERRKMAQGAYYAAQKESVELDESYTMMRGTDKRGKTATHVGSTFVDGKKGANIMKHHETGKYFAAPGANTGFVKGKTQLHDTAKAAADAYHGVNESYELKEAVDPIHAKLKSLGYKKNSSESTPGLNKTWYKHPSGKHPLSTEDLAKHLGHSESDAWKKKYPGEYEGEYGSNDTHDAHTGTRTSKQGGGTLFVGIPKNKKAKSDNLHGRDNDARYESVELEEAKAETPKTIKLKKPVKAIAHYQRGPNDKKEEVRGHVTHKVVYKDGREFHRFQAERGWGSDYSGTYHPKHIEMLESVDLEENKYTSKSDSSDELDARPGAWRGEKDMSNRLKKDGTPTKYEKGMQDNLKARIKMTAKMGGLTGPKGNLPESVELDEALEGSTCKRCDGAGEVRRSVGLKKEICPHCGGTGIDSSKDSVTQYHPKAKPHQAWLKSMKNEEVELDEAIKGRIIPPSSPRHPKHAEWKAAQPKKERKPRAPTVRRAKEIDTSDPKLHKALEKHFGGSFEHFESEPRHGYNEHGHATMTARVTHSYTHKDLGMRPDEMEDTAETHRVKVTKHPEHGYKVSYGLGEDTFESVMTNLIIEKFNAGRE